MITVSVDSLSVRRGDDAIFDGITFQVASGEGLAVVGPNGSGKSTLLRAMAGLLPWAHGSVSASGLDEDETLRTSAHFITPLNAMKPALTVAENLSFWQAFGGQPWLSTHDALDRFGMAHVHDNPFSDLSTGQKRRVSLARLFLNDRPIWLLDEPTSGLDAKSEAMFADVLAEHIARGGLFVAATHLPLGKAAKKTLRFAEVGE